MNVALHAIGNKNVEVNIHEVPGNVSVLFIRVGDAEVNIFLHDGKTEKALLAIEEAIRVFQMEQGK